MDEFIIKYPMCMYHPTGSTKIINSDEEHAALTADGWSENRNTHATIESLLSVASSLREQYAECSDKILGMGGQIEVEIGGNPDYDDVIAKLNAEIERLTAENATLASNLSIAESKLSIMLGANTENVSESPTDTSAEAPADSTESPAEPTTTTTSTRTRKTTTTAA